MADLKSQLAWLVLALACGGLSGPLRAQDGHALGLPPVQVPAANPQTPEKIALGKIIFFDKRLSADGTISCASCHQPDRLMAAEPGVPCIAGKSLILA